MGRRTKISNRVFCKKREEAFSPLSMWVEDRGGVEVGSELSVTLSRLFARPSHARVRTEGRRRRTISNISTPSCPPQGPRETVTAIWSSTDGEANDWWGANEGVNSGLNERVNGIPETQVQPQKKNENSSFSPPPTHLLPPHLPATPPCWFPPLVQQKHHWWTLRITSRPRASVFYVTPTLHMNCGWGVTSWRTYWTARGRRDMRGIHRGCSCFATVTWSRWI